MKTFIYTLVLSVILLTGTAKAQTINWGSFEQESRHMINLNVGWEYGFTYGIGYSYQFPKVFNLFPVVANIEYSFPSGDKMLDDFKTKIGGQIRWVEVNNFQLSTKAHGVFRRYQNDFVRMANFGCEISGAIGYYRDKWFVAGETGFDKAIVTHFKHSQAYRNHFEEVVDGWYEPATGGNFYYGLQTGVSFNRHDINIRAGKVLTQDFKTKPLIPFYTQLGYNIRF